MRFPNVPLTDKRGAQRATWNRGEHDAYAECFFVANIVTGGNASVIDVVGEIRGGVVKRGGIRRGSENTWSKGC